MGFIVTTSIAKSGSLIHEKIRGPLFFVFLHSKFGRQGARTAKRPLFMHTWEKGPATRGDLGRAMGGAGTQKPPCCRRHAGAAPAGRRLLALAHVGAVSVFPFGTLRLRRPVT